MKVFISWSGPRSMLLADALREWIHDVIQSVECFCSTEDIRAGQRWNNEVNSWLRDTDFGILCVTPENMTAPWINFEAGALAKRIDDEARVVPITLGFHPSALTEPLKQFNGVSADRIGILRLMQSITELADPGLNVDRAFDRWWGDLEAKMAAIPESPDDVVQPQPPDVSEMFTELMSSVRGLAGDVRASLPKQQSPVSDEFYFGARILAQDESLREEVAKGSHVAIERLRTWATRALDHTQERAERSVNRGYNQIEEEDV